jgi:F420-dependent oxidoreductase-like protein
LKIGIDSSQHQMTWDQLLERVRFAEEAGFDGAWIFDHFKALYGDPKGPCLEGWTLLAALAAATERIRLGTLVTGITYRHPSLLATEAVTVDHVSRGRLELAVGAAWFQQEHDELGFDFPSAGERVARLDEAIQVMRLLMTQDGAGFEGRYYRLNQATYRPRPVQTPHPPFWIGGSGERKMLPLVGRSADAWHTYGRAADIERKWAIVERSAREAGRKPSDILRSTNLSISEPWDEVEARARELVGLGLDYVIVSWPAEGRPRVEEFLEKVGPILRSD